MLTLLPKGVNKTINTFLIEDFFHLPPLSKTPAVYLELRISQGIFEKIWHGPNGILRALGKLIHEENLSRNCTFKHYPSHKNFDAISKFECLQSCWQPLYHPIWITRSLSVKEECPATNSSCRTWRAPPGGSWECRGGSCAPGPASPSPGSSHAVSPMNQLVSKVPTGDWQGREVEKDNRFSILSADTL